MVGQKKSGSTEYVVTVYLLGFVSTLLDRHSDSEFDAVMVACPWAWTGCAEYELVL